MVIPDGFDYECAKCGAFYTTTGHTRCPECSHGWARNPHDIIDASEISVS